MRKIAVEAALIGLFLTLCGCPGPETPVEATRSVLYNGNGNSSGVVPIDEKEYLDGDAAIVLNNLGCLVLDGYSWGGWNTEPDGSGKAYWEGDSLRLDGCDVLLFANWLHLCSGTISISFTQPMDESITLGGDQALTVSQVLAVSPPMVICRY